MSLFSQNTWAAVRALASQGGEATLEPALHSTGPVQTSAGCLHPFAAAAHIPVVALPTGSAVSIPRRQTPCQENFSSAFMGIFPVFCEKEGEFIPVFQPRTERPGERRPSGERPPAVSAPIPEGIALCEKYAGGGRRLRQKMSLLLRRTAARRPPAEFRRILLRRGFSTD